MKTTGNKLNEIGKANPFKVPAGYFESFSHNIMSQLPEKEKKNPQVLNLWERVRPWVYMAAMVAGVTLMFNVFAHKSESEGIFSKDVKNIPIAEIDELNSYYQDKGAYVSYLDALYNDESNDEVL